MLNNPCPLPLKKLPLVNVILPLTSILPVNSDPLAILSTLKPLLGETEAVTLPLAMSDET